MWVSGTTFCNGEGVNVGWSSQPLLALWGAKTLLGLGFGVMSMAQGPSGQRGAGAGAFLVLLEQKEWH